MASKALRLKRSTLEPPIDPEDQDFASPIAVSQAGLGNPMRHDQVEQGPYFTRKYGSKHHSFWNVPWPLSYEKEILDMDVLLHQLLKEIKGLTVTDFSAGPPTRVLDLGTGLGAWVLDAANRWPNTEFIGLDVVPIQPKLDRGLDPSIHSRITWVTSNFLQPLPFPDGSFDFVRGVNISRGVPESKWTFLFEEVARVLKQGGKVEIIAENIAFPYIPQAISKAASPAIDTPIQPYFGLPRHEHMLLEELFFDVFSSRFINISPVRMITSSMNISLRNVVEVPIHIPSDSSTPDKDSQGDRTPTTPETTHGNTSSIPFPAVPDSPSRLFDWANELRAWQGVLGCKEMMWEELEKKEGVLASLPWSPDERLLRPRQLFELLFLRYEQEMRKCISISSALRKRLGWSAGKYEHNYGAGSVLDETCDWLDKESRYFAGAGEDESTRHMSCFLAQKGDKFALQA